MIFLPREVCFKFNHVMCLKDALLAHVMESVRSIPTIYLLLNGCASRLTMPLARILSVSQAANTTLFLSRSKNLNPSCFQLGKCKYHENEKVTVLIGQDYLGYGMNV